MTDLFGRLAARTLATAPSLRPTGLTRFPPNHASDDAVGEYLLSEPNRPALTAIPQTGFGPDSETTVAHRGDPAAAPESTAPPSPAARHEREPRASDDPLVAERPARVLETTPEDDLGIAEKAARSDSGAPERRRRMEPTQATPGRVGTPPTSSPPTASKPSLEKPARRPQAWEDVPLVELSRGVRAVVSEATPITPPAALAGRPQSQPEETTVRVSIGRLEVRGPERPSPPPKPQPWSEAPMLSLSDYLRGRREGST
jgi:hypothetical protein